MALHTSGTNPLIVTVEISAYRPGSTDPFEEELGWAAAPVLALTLLPVATEVFDVIRASDAGYRTRASDAGGVVVYPPILEGGLDIDRRVPLSPLQSSVAAGWGTIRLRSVDGALQSLVQTSTSQGRPLIVRAARRDYDPLRRLYVDPPLSQFQTIFSGYSGDTWQMDGDTLTIPLRDATYLLEGRTVQNNLFSGAGGVNGTADLANKPRPKLRGGNSNNLIRNISPVLVDPVANIYAVSDTVCSIAAVFEGGDDNSWTQGVQVSDLYATPCPPATWRQGIGPHAGLLQFGSKPQRQITVDAFGGNFPSAGYVPSIAMQVYHTLIEELGLPTSAVDLQQFQALTTASPASGGYWLDSNAVAGETLISQLMQSLNARLVPGRDGMLRPFLLKALTSQVPVASYTAAEIIDVRPLNLENPIDPPPLKWSVGHSRNHTLMVTDLDPDVTGTRKQFLAETWRTAESPINATVAAAYRRPSTPPIIETMLGNATDAGRLAATLDALWSQQRRQLVAVTLPAYLGVREIGDVVSVTYPHGGLSSGMIGQVVGEEWRSSDDQCTLYILLATPAAVAAATAAVGLAPVGGGSGGVSAPTAPLAPSLGSPTTTGLTFSWSAPASGSTGVLYSVQYSTVGSAGPWTTYAAGLSATSVALTGLQPSTAHWARVLAYTSGGQSPYTGVVSASTLAATTRSISINPTAAGTLATGATTRSFAVTTTGITSLRYVGRSSGGVERGTATVVSMAATGQSRTVTVTFAASGDIARFADANDAAYFTDSGPVTLVSPVAEPTGTAAPPAEWGVEFSDNFDRVGNGHAALDTSIWRHAGFGQGDAHGGGGITWDNSDGLIGTGSSLLLRTYYSEAAGWKVGGFQNGAQNTSPNQYGFHPGFHQVHVRIRARLSHRVMPGVGAFGLLWCADDSWGSEIDIFESPDSGTGEKTISTGTVHWDASGGYNLNNGDAYDLIATNIDMSVFHTWDLRRTYVFDANGVPRATVRLWIDGVLQNPPGSRPNWENNPYLCQPMVVGFAGYVNGPYSRWPDYGTPAPNGLTPRDTWLEIDSCTVWSPSGTGSTPTDPDPLPPTPGTLEMSPFQPGSRVSGPWTTTISSSDPFSYVVLSPEPVFEWMGNPVQVPSAGTHSVTVNFSTTGETLKVWRTSDDTVFITSDIVTITATAEPSGQPSIALSPPNPGTRPAGIWNVNIIANVPTSWVVAAVNDDWRTDANTVAGTGTTGIQPSFQATGDYLMVWETANPNHIVYANPVTIQAISGVSGSMAMTAAKPSMVASGTRSSPSTISGTIARTLTKPTMAASGNHGAAEPFVELSDYNPGTRAAGPWTVNVFSNVPTSWVVAAANNDWRTDENQIPAAGLTAIQPVFVATGDYLMVWRAGQYDYYAYSNPVTIV